MVVGEKWPILPQIGRWGVRGRSVVAMGHTSACGVVVVSVGWGRIWAMLSVGSEVSASRRNTTRHAACADVRFAARPP